MLPFEPPQAPWHRIQFPSLHQELLESKISIQVASGAFERGQNKLLLEVSRFLPHCSSPPSLIQVSRLSHICCTVLTRCPSATARWLAHRSGCSCSPLRVNS